MQAWVLLTGRFTMYTALHVEGGLPQEPVLPLYAHTKQTNVEKILT